MFAISSFNWDIIPNQHMELVPEPQSSFIRVKCVECETEMIVFDHAKTTVVCSEEECEEIIAEPSGGKAIINAEIVEKLK